MSQSLADAHHANLPLMNSSELLVFDRLPWVNV
jgi:hypothetical protein